MFIFICLGQIRVCLSFSIPAGLSQRVKSFAFLRYSHFTGSQQLSFFSDTHMSCLTVSVPATTVLGRKFLIVKSSPATLRFSLQTYHQRVLCYINQLSRSQIIHFHSTSFSSLLLFFFFLPMVVGRSLLVSYSSDS